MTLQGFDVNKAVDALMKREIANARAARLRLLAEYLEKYADVEWCVACVDDLSRQLSRAISLPCQAGDRHG